MKTTDIERSARPHGDPYRYKDGGCRCSKCRNAWREFMREQRQERYRIGLAPGDPRHGTANGYHNWGCHCAECTAAWAVDIEKARQRRLARAAAKAAAAG